MTIGLQYEPETEKLTLQIMRANLSQSSLKQNQGIRNLKYTHFIIEFKSSHLTELLLYHTFSMLLWQGNII